MTDFAVKPLPLPDLIMHGSPGGYWLVNCGPVTVAVCHNRATADRIADLLEHHGLLLEIGEATDAL